MLGKVLCELISLAEVLVGERAASDEIRALVLLVRVISTAPSLAHLPEVTITAVLCLLRCAEPVWGGGPRVLHESGAWAMFLDLVQSGREGVIAVGIRAIAHWLRKDETAASCSEGVFVWVDEALETQPLTKTIYLALLEAMTGSVALSLSQTVAMKVDLAEGAMRRFVFPAATMSLLRALPQAEFELQVCRSLSISLSLIETQM